MIKVIRKIGLANNKGNFMGIDSGSGGYPVTGCTIDSGAILYDADDQKGREILKKYLNDFSDKAHGGSSDMYTTLNDFELVTITISYDLKKS